MEQHDLARIRSLAGLTEAPLDVLSPDDALEQDLEDLDAADERETLVKGLIGRVFRDILKLDVESVSYDDASRDADVVLDDVTVDLATLARLLRSGFADSFRIVGSAATLSVQFTVAAGIENAKL